MTTLEDFYFGNIIPHENPIIKGSEYDIANKLVVRHDEALTATLTEQQKEIFQKFKDSYLELLTLGERDAFIRGFSLGIKIAVEALNYSKTRPAQIRRIWRETKNRVSTRHRPTKPTQAICRGL